MQKFPPSIYIDGSNLFVVDNFKYLGSTISSNLLLDVEINARIGKAATVMVKPLCWRRPNAHAYILYSAKDGLDGWDTCRMGRGRIPKDLLYGELEKGTRKTGCPFLRFKDVCNSLQPLT